MRIHPNQKICRNIMMLLTIWLMSIQTVWAQSLSFQDLKETCDFLKGTISYTLPVEKLPENSTCKWTVKVGDQEITDGIKLSDNNRTLTLPLSQETRTVEVSYTDANQTAQTFSFNIEPKVYGKEYNGMKFYADAYDGGDGTKDNPFKINTDLQLAKLAREVTNGTSNTMYNGQYFLLSSDIDLGKGIWMPIGTLKKSTAGYFGGTFDGDGKTIRNMKIYWTTNGGEEASWGLFSRLNGTKDKFATVTNLMIDNARLEVSTEKLPTEEGTIKMGVVVSDLIDYAEVSNIIIKNSTITDRDEKYSTKNTCRIGGIIGYLDGKNYRIFNLSSDTKINIHKKASLSNNKFVTVAGGIGCASTFTKINAILPTNIYIHGPQMVTSTSAKCTRGSVIAFYAANYVKNLPDANIQTLYYTTASKGTGASDYNMGIVKEIADFGNDFIKINNDFISSQQLDKKTWAYSANTNFAFNSIKIKMDRGTSDVLTVVSADGNTAAGTYNWYVSDDNKTWTQANSDACNPFTLPRQLYDQYVYATDGSSRTNAILVKAIHVNADLTTIGNTYTVNVTNDTEEQFTNDKLGLAITYKWHNGDTELSETSSSFTRPSNATYNDKYSCHITVISGSTTLLDTWVSATTVVYLKPAPSITDDVKKKEETYIKDAEYGYSAEKPMLTWKGAYSKLSKKGSWDENIIVLMGESNKDVTNSKTNGFNITDNNGSSVLTNKMWEGAKNSPLFRNATITGKYNNIDYSGSIEITDLDTGLPLWGDTRFEYITFKNTGSAGASYKNIFCQYNNLEMGKGIKMEGFNDNATNYGTIDGAVTTPMQIFGGFNNDGRFPLLDNKEKIAGFEASMPHGKEGFNITIKSGFYSAICAGGRQTAKSNLNGVMGTPNLPIKCTITMDIDRAWNDKYNTPREVTMSDKTKETRSNDYDAGIILAGNHEGAMYADVDIIIRSGKVARIVNGTLGAQTEFELTYNNQTYKVPCNTYMGRANILLDPASSEYKKSEDSKEVDNARVVVTELYGGSMGRGHTGSVKINNPFYGYSTITINGGTFKILPEKNTKKSNILCGIFGAGAGGMNGIGYGDDNADTHTPDESIAYWSDTKDVMLYGPYAAAKNKLVQYHCYNANDYKYTDVDPLLTNTKIIINDGVFGSKTEKIDGIYAGGSGYMSPGLWTSSGAIPSKTGGNVYGSKGKTAVSLTINGGEFHCEKGIFAGGRGTNQYYSSKPYGGTASDYTALGQTYGNVALNINGGNFFCPIFGGGYGVADAKLNNTSTITTLSEMALIKGQSNVTINGGIFFQNIYGSGDMAVVENEGNDATNITIGGDADIRGSVFAGGNGRTRRLSNQAFDAKVENTQSPDLVGKVIGNTNVTFTGSTQQAPYIYGDIYGGGNLAQVEGGTNVNIYAAHFAGQIFGGGKGNITDQNGYALTNKDQFTSADISGDTYVTLAQDMGGQVEGDDGKKKDNFSINVIWNKIWDATIGENGDFIEWNPTKDKTNQDKFYGTDATSSKSHFLNPHNIYGGGNLACNVTGSTFVEVMKGMTPFDLLNTAEWKESYNDNNYPHFSVFGGGYGEYTQVRDTEVHVNVEGDYGIYDAEVNDKTEQLARPHSVSRKSSRKGTRANSDTNSDTNTTTLPVFDNSKGIPNFTILGVLGGGYAGKVTQTTKVIVAGNTFLHRVYGGGFGDPNKTVDNSTGQIGDDSADARAEVFINGGNIYGDVFGGGAGVAPKTANGTHFENVARVNGTTLVQVSDQAKIYGKVFGGGDMANVGPQNYNPDYTIKPISETKIDPKTGVIDTETRYDAKLYRTLVNIIGGDIFGSVYGGGKGLPKAQAASYEKVGRINGNTIVHIANTDITQNISIDYYGNTVPHVWGNIYGGCAYGTVDGNTLVHIEGGMLGKNIFGGGFGDIVINKDEDENQKVLGSLDTEKTATYANILGNTKVQMDGGTWIWNRNADTDGNITTWLAAQENAEKIFSSKEEFSEMVLTLQKVETITELPEGKLKNAILKIQNDKDTQEFFTFTNEKILSGCFKKNNNIYGGGNRACYVGTYDTNATTAKENTGEAIVEINHSPLDDIVDKNGHPLSMFDETTLPGLCWYLSAKNSSSPQFSVFGAGYGANTKVAKTQVYAQPGSKINDNGLLEVNGVKYRYLNQSKDYNTYVAFEKQLYDDFTKLDPVVKKELYGSDGNDKDPNTYQRYRASCLAWTLGLPGFSFQTIHGGGFAGYVTDSTYVETDCQLFCENIYGAGLGAIPYGDYTNSDNYDFGSVTGNSKVFVKSGFIARNLYGGGAGIESVKTSDGEFIDFPNMAHVNKTEVHLYGRDVHFQATEGMIDRTIVMGSVYGGGDVANVGSTEADSTTLVNIRGGSIYSAAFAGGKGRLLTQCKDYKKLGSVKGNTYLLIDRACMTYPYWDDVKKAYKDPSDPENMEHPNETTNTDIIPNLLERIYGGGQNGIIEGNTTVRIYDGYIGHGIYGGGLGSCDSIIVNGQDSLAVTSADVSRNTNVLIYGGRALLTSYWKPETRSWEKTSTFDGITYSPQYDHEALKFKINHNIYAGGNVACIVGGNTYLTMAKGLLHKNTKVVSSQDIDDKYNFFDTNEWKEIYNKVGSPHFCVFGGGYGEHTVIKGDTHVNIAMEGRGSKIDPSIDLVPGQEHKHFWSRYSVMDFVGGGYSGKVEGETFVTGKGGAFCRRLFGGGFYNSVKKTHVNIQAMDCRDIFGGGMMGDVIESTEVNIGKDDDTATSSESGSAGSGSAGSTYTHRDIFIHGSVFGGNDVSGYVNINDTDGYFADNGGEGTHINIYGGHIDGNVYGAGNGDYLYALDRKGNTQVTVNENYPLNPNDPSSEKTPLVYTVPMRASMPSHKAASDAAKMVNINSWRPLTNKVNIHIAGKNANDTVLIKGDVYGGGNSATVLKVKEAKTKSSDATCGSVNIKIGSYVNIHGLFMGCNGDALFTASEDNNFMNKFQKLNGDYYDTSKELNFADSIDWVNDPSNRGISALYLPTKSEERPLVYPHLIDLYFQPVEMNIQGSLDWDPNLQNCTIGSFFCGGNRGNMNIYPDAEGKVVDYTFPKGLTITEKIVGGCNNANYDYNGLVTHEGGYLLGLAHSTKPFINLTIQNQFAPKEVNGAYQGGCVYGGCFNSGTVRGDITIHLQSDLLADKDKQKLEAANDSLATNPKFSSLNVYGAGYGMESYVYGDTRIIMGENISCIEPTEENGKFKACGVTDNVNTEGLGVSANFVYGGGQQGNVIGLTNVDILNGHVFRSVTGGSYSGYVYGSTQVKVGYPTYYQVNSLKNGKYILNRTDQKNRELKNNDGTTESPTIKQEIHLLAGELISQGVYDDIVAIDNGTRVEIKESSKGEYFTKVPSKDPSMSWDNVHIHIDEAIYGGGYSLAQGTSVLANNTTVLKLTEGINAGFGGNTLILVGDSKTSEHITISQQDMKEISLPNGTDLYGYYYKYYDDKNSKQYTYRFIYEQVKYIKGDQVPEGLTGCRENKFYEYDSEGGIFGDGHLSYAQGFRSADITGYGFAGHTINNPKIINTFQRMDLLRLEDNCFSLLGARDYTVNEINKTPYSIARVGEIKMVASDIQLTDGKLQAEQPESIKTSESTQASDAFKYKAKARNYMGLANNIHYVGAVKSNVSFSEDTWHNEYGEASAQKYQEFKQEIITNYEKDKEQNASEFLKRNNGTAKNMIGIASGYALKIQNVQEKIDKATQKMTETIYYGPIYGVVEMNLMNARTGEGGGYVYADNIHEVPEGGKKGFLQTTGNFVFPLNLRNTDNNRYIIDDCSPTGFYAMNGNDPDTTADIHYWYVTGLNYYYNAHITGYTYKANIHFDNDNSDGLTALAGLKKGQEIYIKSWKMRSGHDEKYKCDLETAATAGKYTLYVGASASNTYAGPKTSSETDKDQKKGFAAILSLSEKKEPNNQNSEEYKSELLNCILPAELNGDAKISFRLVDNNTDASPEYYHQHLEKKCQATLVLGAKQLDENRNPKKDEKGNDIEYTYTIFLTIEYVQGPNFTGHITIDNCALPGEMIRLKKDQVKIAADQAFAPNGYFWHIGKLKRDDKGDLQFDEDESWLTKTKDSKNTYKQGDKIDETRTDLFAGSVYDKTLDYLDIPAYYFMNGYGVQLGVTMNGFNDVVFPVTMAAGDTLTVHNYHEMDPHKTGIDLRLSKAIERVSTEKNLAEPRIYISDQDDLKAFGTFISAAENNGGKNAQFILQNDLEIPADYTGSNAIFQGTFHGNVHILRGLEANKTLFAQNQGNIYNLGLLSGSIAQQNGNGTASGYHCCFEYAPSASPDTPIVYDMEGKAITTYTKDDFKYGKVAYDLNGYYLRARTSHSTEADKTALKYVYDYYANGDYQYAHRTDAITGKNTGITYLRTGQDSDLPNYGKAATRHDKTHTIDQARAQDYQAATEETKESRTDNYLPQFNHNEKKGGELMNDFLFWGQDLQSSPALYPARIASQENRYMSNRVYRTAGYYGSTKKGLYHYNAYNQGTKNMGTYVHIPSTTAIDFTAQDDNATSFYDFIIKKGVTQNLLVYTNAESNETSSKDAYDVVHSTLNYDEQTSEERILGHHITKKVVDGNPSYATPLLHLVERTPAGENSEGIACDNNDFCVPISYSVTSHAWYVRKPSIYANDATGAWEGICLPFTVNKAEASLNGEITHFCGEDTHHHEYWLRGLTSVEQNNGKTSAFFQRPGTASGLFQTGNVTSWDYNFENHFFEYTYGDLLYNKVENPYYTQQHTYTGYQPLQAGTPYVVRFPGERFYEFDLSSAFYNNLKNAKEPAQTVTFHAFGESYAGDDAKTKGAIVIPITAEMKTLPAEMKTATSGYAHMGTFAAQKVAEGAVYGMNAQGTAFDDASTLATVMPFRTYMAKTQTAAQTRSANPSVIHIAETTGIDRIEPEVNGNEEDSESGDHLIIRSIGSRRVKVESTYSIQLKVLASTGQLYRILDVQPGTATYSGFHPGLYIFGKAKVIVK